MAFFQKSFSLNSLTYQTSMYGRSAYSLKFIDTYSWTYNYSSKMLRFGCESLKLKSWTPKTIASKVKLHKESKLIEQDLKNLVKFVRATIAYWN